MSGTPGGGLRAEVVVVGNELLNGDLADTNTASIAKLLRQCGLVVSRGQTVPDDPAAIVDALAAAAERAQLVVVTGGLGPTEDDLTIRSAAEFAGRPLVEHEPTLRRLEAMYAARKLPFTPNNARQALAPEGAEVLTNPVGTAPSVRMEHEETTFFFFPGVPRELHRLAADYLLPWLEARGGSFGFESHSFKTFGKTESQVATLMDALPRDPDVHVAYRAHFPEIHVGLQAVAGTDGASRLPALVVQTRGILGDLVFTEDPDESFTAAVARLLTAAGATVATAESCTAGLLSAMLTEIPGSSAYFVEGAATYTNEAKIRRLGVPAELIAAHGAVSEPVARAMAEGIRAASGATFGLGTTGIAGPGGGTPDKPVGSIHVALATPSGTLHKFRRMPFERDRNRVITAYMALEMLRRALSPAT